MAEYFHEGFDNYYQVTDLQLNVGKVQWSNISNSYLDVGRGNQGKSLVLGTAQFTTTQTFTEAFIGMGIKSQNDPQVQFWDVLTGTLQCYINISASYGYVQLYGGGSQTNGQAYGGTLLYTSAANATNLANWAFLEIHALIDPTGGKLEVKYNNALVATISGVKTRYSGNSWFNMVAFYGNHYLPTYVDDLRLFDTTTGPGTYPCNSWGGDLRVQTVYPNANGTVTWTPLSGTNFSEINDPGTHAIGTTYNSTSTVGSEDTFVFQALSSIITEIISVQIKGAYTETDAASHTVRQLLHISGTDYGSGTDWTLASGGITMFTDQFVTNPATSASWSLSDVNGLLGAYKAIS